MLPDSVPILGPWQGQLANSGEELQLLHPDQPQGPDRPDAGFVPHVPVDQVRFSDRGAWPAAADGTGASLQRRDPSLYGNEPLHWHAATPTPGLVNENPTALDSDSDGIPDDWEMSHGGNPDVPDAANDRDQDGLNARDEYMLGTDDRNPDSRLALNIEITTTEVRVRFVAQPNRSYTLEFSPDVSGSPWIKLYDVPADTTERPLEIVLPLPGYPAPRYLRLVCPGRF
jgi:hypothetical protein